MDDGKIIDPKGLNQIQTPEVPGAETPREAPLIVQSLGDYIPARVVGGFYKQYVDTLRFRYRTDEQDEGHMVELVDPEARFMVSTNQWRDHTYIIALKHILPEDLLWRKENERVPALVCMEDDHACMCPYKCLRKLAVRCFILFEYNPTVEQIIITFKREEKPLHRDLSGVTRPYTPSELQQGFQQPQKAIPRFWLAIIHRDFADRPQPYILRRGNYDAITNVLRTSRPENVFVGPQFWLLSF